MDKVLIDGKNFSSMTVDLSYTNWQSSGCYSYRFYSIRTPNRLQIVGKKMRDVELLIVAQQLFNIGGDFRIPPKFIQNH